MEELNDILVELRDRIKELEGAQENTDNKEIYLENNNSYEIM